MCILLFASLTACGQKLDKNDSRAAVEFRKETRIHVLRETSRSTLMTNCGECHIGGTSTAIPDALAIFDLSAGDWSARMSEAQLKNAEWRLASDLGAGLKGPRELNVPLFERQQFHEFVELEVRRRAELSEDPVLTKALQ